MLHVDLTSGLGGFALAARWLGWTTVGFCEIEPWCQKLLAQNFPGVPIHDDLKTLTPDIVRGWLAAGTLPDTGRAERWVLTAGYPCQPFSHAGKRRGEDDPRHLWPHIAGLLAGFRPEERPDWTVWENVRGHVSMGLDGVLDEMEALGYACQTYVVPAASVGALHKRDRVWIVGSKADAGRAVHDADDGRD